MKRPRLLTAEEIRHWRETNKHTKKLRALAEQQAPSSPPEGEPNPSSDLVGGNSKRTNPLTETLKSVSTLPQGESREYAERSRNHLSPLKQLSIREAARSFKPYGPIEATLDLHGLTKLEAYERVQHFIIEAKRRGKRHVTIITGKGRGGEVGVLRANLPHWLNEPALRPLISAVAEARAEKGGAGVMHVLVKAT